MTTESDGNAPGIPQLDGDIQDLAGGLRYIEEQTGAREVMIYGISSGALKAALFAQRHPERIARLALDAFVRNAALSQSVCKLLFGRGPIFVGAEIAFVLRTAAN